MSTVAQHLATWLIHHPTLDGVIAAIYPVQQQEDRQFPCLVYSTDEATRDNDVSPDDNTLVFKTFSITLFSKDYPELDAAAQKIEKLHKFRGDADGLFVQALFIEADVDDVAPEPNQEEIGLLYRNYKVNVRYQTDDVPDYA